MILWRDKRSNILSGKIFANTENIQYQKHLFYIRHIYWLHILFIKNV